MSSEPPYDPLARDNLARSIATQFESGPLLPLAKSRLIKGAGVYALYYAGSFAAYQSLSTKNKDKPGSVPIYVGKAIPSGGRKGELTLDSSQGSALASRLGNHATSIRQAQGLDIADFQVRYLVVADIWIPLGESMLIQTFKPIWNVLIDGFGNNQPGKGRENQVKSLWDTLHPGRKRMRNLPDNPLTANEVVSRIEDFISGKSVPEVDERDSPITDDAESE